MDEIIEHIIKNRIKCYFVSPHQDDAVYSAGGLISYLSGKTDVTIINVFNGFGKEPYTLSAKSFLKQVGFKYPEKLSEQRNKEDEHIKLELNINIIDLNFDDALYRKKILLNKLEQMIGNIIPELLHIYPIYKLNIKRGKISTKDQINIMNITKKLMKIINIKDSIIFCPLALGGHVDHKIVRKVCEENFDNVIMWSDFPYNKELINYIDINNAQYRSSFQFKYFQNKRYLLSKFYQSQIKALCANKKLRMTPERYLLFKHHFGDNGFDTNSLKFSVTDELNRKIENEWNNLWSNSNNANFYNSVDWFKVCQSLYVDKKYFITLCYRNSDLFAVLPLIQNNIFGKRVYFCPGGRYLDKTSLLIKENNKFIITSIIKFIVERFNNIILSEIDEEILLSIPKKDNIRIVKSSVNPYIPPSKNKLEYVSSRHRSKIEKVLNSNSDEIKLVEITKNKLEYMNQVIEIEEGSTRRGEGRGTFNSELDKIFFYNLFKIFDKYIFLIFLFHKNSPSAYRIGLSYKGTFYTLNTAYKKEAISISPGKLLLYYTLNNLVQKDIQTVDMLRGDCETKSDLSPYYENRYNLYISNSNILLNYLYIKDILIKFIIKNKNLYQIYLALKLRFANK